MTDKELKKMKSKDLRDLISTMRYELDNLRKENTDLNEELDSILCNNNDSLPPEPEAEVEVITNEERK